MTSWLDQLRADLDKRTTPAVLFIRDDDGGWADDALDALLDIAGDRGVPIDVALIPDACDERIAGILRGRRAQPVHLHQHGRAHINHELDGRKCEFGLSRRADQQRADIRAGRQRLLDLVGDRLEPIFTPPWNRCTEVTVQCLVDLGFRLLSRDVTAPPANHPQLAELPVSLDWTGRHGVRAGVVEWGLAIAECVRRSQQPVGLMLHHAVMSDVDRRLLSEFLDVVAAHPMAACTSMLELAHAPRGVL